MTRLRVAETSPGTFSVQRKWLFGWGTVCSGAFMGVMARFSSEAEAIACMERLAAVYDHKVRVVATNEARRTCASTPAAPQLRADKIQPPNTSPKA